MGNQYADFGALTIVDKKTYVPEMGQTVYDIVPDKAIIIATIRMGFGHWRMAIAFMSAAHKMGYTPYILDLMSFENSSAQKIIKSLQKLYDFFSRLSQSSRWFNDHLWEKFTSTQNKTIDSCVTQRYLSALFVPVFEKLPRTVPLLSMHPWAGHGAVLSGMTNVVSTIPDNYPMAFWLVEGSRHTVQSPSSYMGYRTLLEMSATYPIIECIPESMIFECDHYVDYELTATIETDCAARIHRLETGKARRFLLTMGGAGAQVYKFAGIISACTADIATGRATFFINMGDHAGRWEALRQRLDATHTRYILHNSWEHTKQFITDAQHSEVNGIHVFLHDTFYEAVYLTNLLMHISDIMITKPSELSFYPIPKLFIQRVGRHEAWGAIRGSEIGDGTIEAASQDDLYRTLHLLISDGDLLKLYVKHILENHTVGIYNGAHNAVRYATAP